MLPSLIAAAVMAQADPHVIPKPASVRLAVGEFVLASDASISALGELEPLGRSLQGHLSPPTGYRLPVGRNGNISLGLDKRLKSLGPEGYRVVVKHDRIEIRAPERAGVFYGIQTLRQLFSPEIFRKSDLLARVPRITGQALWRVPCMTIEDSPRFGWRGAMMDVSRHFMPKEFVLKFLDLMALHKLNVFHWHLTDDHGWRIEIKRYPRLTAHSSSTDYSDMNPKGATRSINQRPGGYYTQEDVREIVRYAADRFITVVPEIELPGHSLAAIKAYPELGNKDQTAAARGDAKPIENWDNVFNVDDRTISFLKGVLDEVLELFPSQFIHIGGDEVWKEPWKKNPLAQERMRALGLKNEEELQSWFVRQFDEYLVAKGRRLIGWDEILEGGLAPNAAVMSWRGTAGGIAAAKAGHDVVMSPTSHTYFDYYQTGTPDKEPKAIGGNLPLSTVYSFDPIPAELSPAEGRRVMGAQAQLWSEFIPHPKHMEYMSYPRYCALAEVVWSPREGRNYEDFLVRLNEHLKRLDVIDVNYRRLDKGEVQRAKATTRAKQKQRL